MSSPLENVSIAARESRKTLAGVVVILQRGSIEGRAVATVGETRVEELINGEVIVSVRHRDFFIDSDEYCFNAGPVAPLVDDRIIQQIKGLSVVFQVTPASNEREYRRSDRFGHTWRIHTKEARGNEVSG